MAPTRPAGFPRAVRLRPRPRLPLHPCLRLMLFACALPLACTNAPPPDEAPADAADNSGDPAPAPAQQPQPTAPAELPERSEFVDHGLRHRPASRADLRETLGAPDSVATEVIPNRHVPGVMDTIYTVHYADLVARFHHPGGGGDLLSMLQVSDDRHLRYPVIGADVVTLDAAFGRPDEASDSSLTYHCTTCEAGNDPVEIIVLDGQVRRVRFNYYVD